MFARVNEEWFSKSDFLLYLMKNTTKWKSNSEFSLNQMKNAKIQVKN